MKYAAVAKGRAFPVTVALDPPGRVTLTDEGGSTRLSISEEFTGPLVKVMARSMPDLQPSFDQYVAGVRARAEG